MMPPIEISNELYRALQAVAVPLEDRTEDVIWRLLHQYQAARGNTSSAHPAAPVEQPSTVRTGLVSAGVLIPDGLQLRFNYKGQLLPAAVKDGRLWIEDRGFTSPSRAASAAASKLGAPGRSLNGWWYWEYDDNGTWRRLRALRKPGQTRRRPGR